MRCNKKKNFFLVIKFGMRCSASRKALAPSSPYSVFARTHCRRILSSLRSLPSFSFSSSSSSSSQEETTVPRVTLNRVPKEETERIAEILEELGYTDFAQVNDDALKGTDDEEEIFYSRDSKGNDWIHKKWSFNNVQLYFSKEVLVRDVRKAVKQLETYLGPLNAVYDNVDANKWQSVILDSYKDIVVDDEFIIRCMKSSDENQKQKNKTYKTEIVLTPGVAFGTGDHPTTLLCLQFLKRHIKASDEVVDFGCGTGILAIGALKLGAARAYGVDIDAVAVESAKSNALINGVQDRFKAVLGDGMEPDAEEPKDVDVLVANILITPNLELSSKFVKMTRKGGKIGLSGILAGKQAEEVIEKYSSEGCAEFEVYEKDEWVCIECTVL